MTCYKIHQALDTKPLTRYDPQPNSNPAAQSVDLNYFGIKEARPCNLRSLVQLKAQRQVVAAGLFVQHRNQQHARRFVRLVRGISEHQTHKPCVHAERTSSQPGVNAEGCGAFESFTTCIKNCIRKTSPVHQG
ncbi:hypothetical protein ACMFMG_004042 [Clarireedia jacksonii]